MHARDPDRANLLRGTRSEFKTPSPNSAYIRGGARAPGDMVRSFAVLVLVLVVAAVAVVAEVGCTAKYLVKHLLAIGDWMTG